MFLKATSLLAVINYSTTRAERTWLSRLKGFPSAKTLEVAHFYTITPDSGAEVTMAGPVALANGLGKSYQVSLVSHEALDKLSHDTEAIFCCSDQMITEGKCKEKDTLYIPGGSHSFTMSQESIDKGFAGDVFRPEPGFWYVTVSNCGDTDSTSTFISGELVVSSRFGYLPGEESPKLAFYLYLFLAYSLIFGVWVVICSSWSSVLLKIHHYISITALVGALEAICWYASLYHWNYLGHRWWSMIALASLGTVLKQGVSYGLLLLACLGLGITKPRLQGRQIIQCLLLVIAFIISDGIRQMALVVQDRVHGIESNWKVFLLVSPGSLFVSLLYVWILQALQDTIQELTEKGQTVKLAVFTNLRLSMAIACGLVTTLVAYETFVIRQTDVAQNWETRWVFTDAMSHAVFFFLIVIMMFLWRPTENSLQLAYSEQIGAEMEDQKEGIEMGRQKEFQSVDVELGDE